MELTLQCPTDKGTIHYQTRGDGAPVLLIMGFMARGRAWRSQVESLSSHFKVLWFDHRGVGDSPGPAASSMYEFAQDCLALMDHVGWNQVHVVGISMGGMIAQELALMVPSRLLSLTLLVTHSGGGVKVMLPPWRGLPYLLIAQLAWKASWRFKALKYLLIPRSQHEFISEDEMIRKLREDFSPKPPLSTRLAHINAIRKHDTTDRLSTLTISTLIIHATQDLLVKPAHCAALTQLITGSSMISFENAGHGLIRQSRVDINTPIIKHLKNNE